MEYLPILRTLLVKYALLLCNCYQYIRYQWHMYYYTNSLYLFQYTCSHVFAWHINPRNQYYISNTFIWHKSILLFVQEWIIQAPTTGNNNECPFFFYLEYIWLTYQKLWLQRQHDNNVILLLICFIGKYIRFLKQI